MTAVTNKQVWKSKNRRVWKEMKKMISNGIILYAISEPPLIILKEHYGELQKNYPELAMSFKE